ncbi:type II secretion system GspH family protein [Shewanella electrodiphila]|uniref:Type II secretion system GspH family protein n=1 Tax=Shewanella electrodiphila TaxID=934143 RepID=A0ABT0KR86_9GAMM|nr:type II secretion system protein [Shewanella electrodiphila]MCL1046367.1 type II secretion system GspH family protein [Shewanella electrodiphila]
MKSKRGLQQAGFTLVEMVTVIIILGILVVGVSSFVIFGTRIFVESSSVGQVLGQSRFAVERMTRDIRHSVPNSVRLRTASLGIFQCIEMLPIEASSSYLKLPIYPDSASSTGTIVDNNIAVNNGMFAIVYPLANESIGGVNDIYQASRNKRFEVQSATSAADKITLTFANSVQFAEQSPIKRIYFANQPISYCFESPVGSSDVSLYRYSNYGYIISQPVPSNMGAGVLMAENITNSLLTEPAIKVTEQNLMTNSIVHLEPRFSVNGETFKYQHQVQVTNVP